MILLAVLFTTVNGVELLFLHNLISSFWYTISPISLSMCLSASTQLNRLEYKSKQLVWSMQYGDLAIDDTHTSNEFDKQGLEFWPGCPV